MRVLKERPPNYAAIIAAFPLVARRHGILYAYGDAIFNPDGITITPALQAHEEAHGARQLAVPETQVGDARHGGPAHWWAVYLADPSFRLAEEIVAHRVEWQKFLSEGHGRKERRAYMAFLASRLSSPLYGGLTTAAKAKRIIGAEEKLTA